MFTPPYFSHNYLSVNEFMGNCCEIIVNQFGDSELVELSYLIDELYG